jgi:hypothetical protein
MAKLRQFTFLVVRRKARSRAAHVTPCKAAAGRAAELLDAVTVPKDLLAPLAPEWVVGCQASPGRRRCRGGHGKNSERDRVLARVTAAAASLLDAGRAASAGELTVSGSWWRR